MMWITHKTHIPAYALGRQAAVCTLIRSNAEATTKQSDSNCLHVCYSPYDESDDVMMMMMMMMIMVVATHV